MSMERYAIDSAFSVDDNRYVHLESALKGNTLIVKFSKQDCDVCIKQVLKILSSDEFAKTNVPNFLVMASGFTPHEALVVKNDWGIPFRMYIADLAGISFASETGPKLFIVNKDYIVRDLFFPVYENPENLKLYLRQGLNAQ